MTKVTVQERYGNYTTTDSRGQLQSENDNPSHIDARGTMSWHDNGVLHRDHGPAVKAEKFEIWYKHGKIHRDGDEPAFHEDKGRKVMYYKDDRPHRVFGPAIIYVDGPHKEEQYWINGQKFGDRDVWEPVAAPLRALETKAEPETPVEIAIEEILNKPRKKKTFEEVADNLINLIKESKVEFFMTTSPDLADALLEKVEDAEKTIQEPDVIGYVGDAPGPFAAKELSLGDVVGGIDAETELKTILDQPPLTDTEFYAHVENQGNPPAQFVEADVITTSVPAEAAPVEKKERKKREKKIQSEQ